MSTSNSFVYTESTSSVINDAVSYLGKLSDNDTLSPGDYNLALRFLNRLTKSWIKPTADSPGMKMWRRRQGYIFQQPSSGLYTLANNCSYWTDNFVQTLSAGNNSVGSNVVHLQNTSGITVNSNVVLYSDTGTVQYATVQSANATSINISSTLTAALNSTADYVYAFANSAQPPQVVNWVNLRDVNGNDVFIDILTYEEFVALPSKQSSVYQGDPVACYVETHLVGSSPHTNFYTDVNGGIDFGKYLVVDYVVELQDWVNPNDQPDFEKGWFRALVLNLARDLARPFHATWNAQDERLANEALMIAKKQDPKKLAVHFSRSNRGGAYRQVPHR